MNNCKEIQRYYFHQNRYFSLILMENSHPGENEIEFLFRN